MNFPSMPYFTCISLYGYDLFCTITNINFLRYIFQVLSSSAPGGSVTSTLPASDLNSVTETADSSAGKREERRRVGGRNE